MIPYAAIALQLFWFLIPARIRRGRHRSRDSSSSHDLLIAITCLYLTTVPWHEILTRWPTMLYGSRPLQVVGLAAVFLVSNVFYASIFSLLCAFKSSFRRRLLRRCRCRHRSRGNRGDDVIVVAESATYRPNDEFSVDDSAAATISTRRTYTRRTRTFLKDADTRGGASGGQSTVRVVKPTSFRRRTSWTCSPKHGARRQASRTKRCSMDRDDLLDDDGVVLCESGVTCQHSICMATLPRANSRTRHQGVTTFVSLTGSEDGGGGGGFESRKVRFSP